MCMVHLLSNACTLHCEDTVPRSTSMQLFLAWTAFISASSINQVVSRKSCHCFPSVFVSSHRWIQLLPSIECFLPNKTTSLLVLNRYFGFIGSISLLSICGLARTSLMWIIQTGMTWTSFQMWIYFCDICVCMVVHLIKLPKAQGDIIYVSEAFMNIAPSPRIF